MNVNYLLFSMGNRKSRKVEQNQKIGERKANYRLRKNQLKPLIWVRIILIQLNLQHFKIWQNLNQQSILIGTKESDLIFLQFQESNQKERNNKRKLNLNPQTMYQVQVIIKWFINGTVKRIQRRETETILKLWLNLIPEAFITIDFWFIMIR